MARVLPLTLMALLAVGCGEDEPRGTGRLVVDKMHGGPSFIEGSLTELTVRDADGRAVLEVRQLHPGSGPMLARWLAAGEYRLHSRERPCQGNCGLLDPPAARCEVDLEIRPGRTTHAVVLLAGGAAGCSAG